jgi:hypothetical protein
MKHTNQKDSSRNQGSNTDQQKKTGKMQGDKNESMAQQHSRGTKDDGIRQGSESSSWQKDKQGHKK